MSAALRKSKSYRIANPFLLVNGLLLATELDRELRPTGDPPLEDLLGEIERRYGELTELSAPDQVLFL